MLGEDALSNAWTQGIQELRDANDGKMAMDAPPIEPQQQPEQSSYAQMLAETAQQPAMDQGQGIDR